MSFSPLSRWNGRAAAFTQWIGGIGIIIFVLSFMPLFGGSTSYLYNAEATGISKEQLRPRISDITRNMAITYLVLTAVGFLLLWAGPMDAFDAACHTGLFAKSLFHRYSPKIEHKKSPEPLTEFPRQTAPG